MPVNSPEMKQCEEGRTDSSPVFHTNVAPIGREHDPSVMTTRHGSEVNEAQKDSKSHGFAGHQGLQGRVETQ